ncbi:hypothetical protein TB1_039203 [Malus domestica]
MAMHGALLFSYAFFILILSLSLPCTWDHFLMMTNSHRCLTTLAYSKESFNGFAAKRSDQEREKLASMKEVISVFPSTPYHASLRCIMPTFCKVFYF